MFIRGMSDDVKAKIAHFGMENIEPGDVYLTNDTYITGSHLNHMIFTVPVFNDGELVASLLHGALAGRWRHLAWPDHATSIPKACRCRS